MRKLDNPPAFPPANPASVFHTGMTLRDYFAAHLPAPDEQQVATQEGLDRGRNPHNDSYKPPLRSRDQIIAELRYRAADAMLAARQTGGDA